MLKMLVRRVIFATPTHTHSAPSQVAKITLLKRDRELRASTFPPRDTVLEAGKAYNREPGEQASSRQM